MGLNARITAEDYEALDESLQSHYAAKGGEYVLQVSGIEEHPTVTGLQKAYEAEKERAKSRADKLKSFGELTPEDVSELQEELETLRDTKSGDLISAEELKELKTSHKDLAKRAKEAEKLGERLQKHESFLQTHTRESLEARLAKAGVRDELVEAAADHIMARYDVQTRESDNGFSAVVSGEVNGVPGEHALDEFVGEWSSSEKADVFRKPLGKGGSGADPNNRSSGGGAGQTVFDRNDPAAWGKHADAVVADEAKAQ